MTDNYFEIWREVFRNALVITGKHWEVHQNMLETLSMTVYFDREEDESWCKENGDKVFHNLRSDSFSHSPQLIQFNVHTLPGTLHITINLSCMQHAIYVKQWWWNSVTVTKIYFKIFFTEDIDFRKQISNLWSIYPK